MKRIIVISTSLRHGSNSDMLADKFVEGAKASGNVVEQRTQGNQGLSHEDIHSSLDWQKDDIEYAIASYVDDMSQELYEAISDGRTDFLRDHKRFQEDITIAVEKLEIFLLNR